MNIDEAWSQTEPAAQGAGSFEPIPTGTKVTVVVTDQKGVHVGEKNTPVAKVTLEVTAPKEYEGKKVFHDLWLTGPNLPYLKRDLAFFGWSGRPSQLMEESDTSLVGLGAQATVAVREYHDKEGNVKKANEIKFFDGPFVKSAAPVASSKPPSKVAATNPPAAAVAGGKGWDI